MADMRDGTFSGIRPSTVSSPGDASVTVTQGHMGPQSYNEYTSMLPDEDEDDY